MSAPTTTLRIRPAAVAGRFYPADPAKLRTMVRGFIDQSLPAPDTGLPRAIIGPHAGYPYSGPIAGSVYAAIANLRGRIDRVVLIGPAHYVPFTGIAAPSADAFATPLGDVRLDREGIVRALTLPFVHSLDEAHAPEHGLEVHLPFLQHTLGDFALLPFVVSDSSATEVAQLLEMVWPADDPRTLLVVSSDLSHYQEYDDARRLDLATKQAIESLAPHAIAADQACGQLAVQALLLCAQRRGLRLTTLDLRSSGDTAGSRDRVVGYGAWVAA